MGTLVAFATFWVGFLARPLGGIIFGHFGDRLGRKKTLVITLLMMGIATTLIGLLPGYSSIGVAAPILLVCIRMVQGIGLGGEWGGSVLIASEHAPQGQVHPLRRLRPAGLTRRQHPQHRQLPGHQSAHDGLNGRRQTA
ncbi:hypothetical protein GCM10010271_03970 [Streptomyces kurssanovii]|nr:hypothetical protein GCM10010271_03970 [Streptomyces kurssanovii]